MPRMFKNLVKYGCEEVAFFYDEKTGIKAIIVIHDTTLGPALGGTRLWDYPGEEEALIDALRLARGMSRKASISGLDAGGLISAYIDWKRGATEEIMKKVEEIGDLIERIISISKKTGEPTYAIADKLAYERIMRKKTIKSKMPRYY